MSEELWNAVDHYLVSTLEAEDEVLRQALEASRSAGLPEIAVSAPQGKLLMLLALSVGARRILEIGTLGAYSAIWMARALPEGGRLVSLEFDPSHAEVARENLARAGLEELVEVQVGPALDLLPQLQGPFDLSFIDADKENNARYFEWALKLSRPGGLVVVDNVVRKGSLVEAESSDPGVQSTRRMLEQLHEDPRVDATVIQTVGVKGHDGFLLARVRS